MSYDNLEPYKILIIDNSENDLNLLSTILTDFGYGVHSEKEGRLAVKAAIKTPPDLILLGIMMPGMDGFEVYRQLKAKAHIARVPVIFISALDSAHEISKVFKTGGVDYITQPFKSEEVLARVQTHLKIQQMQTKLKEQNFTLQQEAAIRSRLKEKQDQSEFRFHSVLEALPDPVVIYDSEGRTEYINPGFQKLYGWHPEELLNKSIDFVPEDELEPTRLAWQRTLAGENIFFETRRLTKSGQLLNIEIRTAILNDKDGKHTASIVIHRNITERILAENQLKQYRGHLEELVEQRTAALHETNEELRQEINERKQTQKALASEKIKLSAALKEMDRLRLYLNNIIDSMPSVLVGVDQDGCVTHWNRQAEAMTDITADKACGHPLPPLFEELKLQLDDVRASIRQKTSAKMEKVAHKVDGETRFADVTIYPLVTNGAVGAVIRVDDVTTRVRIEDMMVQTEKMLSVGGLAAGMAHEINNPLSGILMSLQNIEMRLSCNHPKNREAARVLGVDLEAFEMYLEDRSILKFISSIRNAATRASIIVNNMLNFTRKSESPMAPASLARLLEESAELAAHDYDLKKKYDFRKIEILREFPPDIPEIACIVTEIEQVVLNLLRNAAQAMSDSTVDDQPPRIVLRLANEGGMVRLEVEDNGPGMAPEIRKRVFEPFFTTKEVGLGTGLGLSVSYFIITQHHGGTMMVESESGKGARFIIRLPVTGGAA
ncbi:MAG: PAS domain S-box protein [Pseudomonadota bacterium]